MYEIHLFVLFHGEHLCAIQRKSPLKSTRENKVVNYE
jgi:hypothetical protein